MTEKRKRMEKPGRPAGPEQPRITEKIQPMGLKDSTSNRDEFGSLARGLVDEMGRLGTPVTEFQARKAVEHGWANKGERDYLNGVVGRWSKALGINIRTSFDDTKGGGAREGEVNFTQVFAEDVRKAPDIIVGHEGGHCIEHQKTGWSVDEFRRNEDYLGQYIREGFEHERHRMPPFSLTKYHQMQQGRMFDLEYDVTLSDNTPCRRCLRQDIGLNARQIYCDSIPFKAVLLREKNSDPPIIRLGRPVTIDLLIDQYLNYLEAQFDQITVGHHSRELAGPVPLNMVPVIARFGASAWGMELLAKKIPKKESRDSKIRQLRLWSDGFLNLFGHPGLGRGQILELRKCGLDNMWPDDQRLLIKFTHGEDLVQSNAKLTPDETVSILVLTRAYKQHFMACLGLRELIQDDDLRPHIERLHDGTTSLKIREMRFTGDIIDHRPVSDLLKRIEDIREEPIVKAEAIKTISRVERKNLKPLLTRLLHNHPEAGVRWEAASALGQHFGLEVWDDLMVALREDDSPEVRSKVSALVLSLGNFSLGRYFDEKVAVELDRVMREDPSPDVRASYIRQISWCINSPEFKFLIERFDNEKDPLVRGFILNLFTERYVYCRDDDEGGIRETIGRYRSQGFKTWLEAVIKNEKDQQVKEKALKLEDMIFKIDVTNKRRTKK